MNEVPPRIRAERIGVRLTEISRPVGIQQFFDGIWIAANSAMKEIDGPRVLLSAKDRLLLTLTLQLVENPRQGFRYGNEHHRH